MITAVGGHGGYSGGKQFITAEDLRQKLSHLRDAKALIVKLVNLSLSCFLLFMLLDWIRIDLSHGILGKSRYFVGLFVLIKLEFFCFS